VRGDVAAAALQDLVGFLGELKGAGVDLYLDRQGVDTSTPAGKALFQMRGVRALNHSREDCGGHRQGAKSGKPIGRARIAPAKEASIRAALASGKGILKVARVRHRQQCGTAD
jgi:DNA invertase Pin-like site-specific DNA recombinase